MRVDVTSIIVSLILVDYIVCTTLQEAVHAPLWTFNAAPDEIPQGQAMENPEGATLTVVARGGYIVGYIIRNNVRPFYSHDSNPSMVAIRISDGQPEAIATHAFAGKLGIFQYLPLDTEHKEEFKLLTHNPLHSNYQPNHTGYNPVQIDYSGHNFFDELMPRRRY